MQSIDIQDLLEHATQQHFKGNAIVEYIADYYNGDSWKTVESFIQQLESASCANGSFGVDTIYTHLILEKLSDESWRDAINQALESYADATGEDYTPDTINLESLVTFAVDWFAGELASYLRSHNRVWVVVTDAYSASEERNAFLFESDADAFLDKWKEAYPDDAENEDNYYTIEERV